MEDVSFAWNGNLVVCVSFPVVNFDLIIASHDGSIAGGCSLFIIS